MRLAIGQEVMVVSPDIGRYATAATIIEGPVFMSAGLMFKVRLSVGGGRMLWVPEAAIRGVKG